MENLQIEKLFNDNISLSVGYYKEDGTTFLNDHSIKEELHKILKLLDEKKKILYRGFSYNFVDSNFWKFIFTVGEKGSHFRKKTFNEIHGKKTNYFSDHYISSEQNYLSLLSELQNNILPKYKHKSKISNIENLTNRFEQYRIKKTIAYEDMYYILLVWLHNIGNVTGLKFDSPLVSTTTSLDVAFKFHNQNNKSKYAYIILLSDQNICDYLDTNNLNKILKELDINWHDNIHQEIMFKDVIFPHSIIGVIEKNKEENKLVINPNLLHLLECDLDSSSKVEFLEINGILIESKGFDEGIKALGYDKIVEQKEYDRTISNSNGESYVVGPLNSLNSL